MEHPRFNQRLLAWAEAAGIPGRGAELARHLGKNQQAVNRWMSGDTVPGLADVPMLARVLNVPEDEITASLVEETQARGRGEVPPTALSTEERLNRIELRMTEVDDLARQCLAALEALRSQQPPPRKGRGGPR